MISNIYRGIIFQILGPILNFFGIRLPPDFSDDPTDPSTLLTYSTKTTTDQVGDTRPHAGWSRKARGYNVTIGDEIAIPGTTLTQGGGTAVLAHDGTKVTVTTGGTLWGFDVDGEMFYCADATLAGDGGFCIGDGGTAAPITTTDIVAFHAEFTDGLSGIDLNVTGFSIGTGIYDGQFIPPHADNPNLDAFGNPLQYRTADHLKYDLELVDSPCLDFSDEASSVDIGAIVATFDSDILYSGSIYTTSLNDGIVRNIAAGIVQGTKPLKVYQNGTGGIQIAVTSMLGTVYYRTVIPTDFLLNIMVISDGTSVTLNVNGSTSSISIDSGLDSDMSALYFGRHQVTATGFFNGLMWNQWIGDKHFPMAEVIGPNVYDTDGNAYPITTTDLNDIRSGLQSEYHAQIKYGWWDAGDGVYYPFNKDGTSTFHQPGILNGAYVLYQKLQAPQVIKADQTADVAGTGPVWFDALGNRNKLTETDIRAVYNYNMQGYMCGQDIWDYTNKLNATQDIESKTYSACYYTYDLMSDGGLLLADGIQLVNTSITE